MRELSVEELRLVRMRAQGLAPRWAMGDGTAGHEVARVVAGAGGIQAQQWSAARLSVRARSVGLRADDVEHAREVDRSVLRGWFMRGTLHLVATDDLEWLLALYAPVNLANSERRYGKLGLDPATRERGVEAIRAAVADRGPLTRGELVDELLRRGVRIDPRSQAVPHLIAHACFQGAICHGPHRNGEPAFALLRDWVPARPTLDPDAALDELARRYLDAFGPSTVEDFAVWSGMPRRRARAAWRRIGGELMEVRAAETAMWMLHRRAAVLDVVAEHGDALRLLPAFDTYLLGYASRALIVEQAHAGRVWPGGGILHPTAVAAGRAVATWRYEAGSKTRRPLVRVAPFTADGVPHARLQEETADIGRFLGSNPTLLVE